MILDKNLMLAVKKNHDSDKVVALAGNPNVGKSTVFNELTGLKQHTGNWPGKTVTNTQGYCTYRQTNFVLVDLPGCYSLIAHSAEEEAARDFIYYGRPDAVVIVCDSTCFERNLNLVLQIIEITPYAVVCVNLMDEAEKKKIHIDLQSIFKKIGIPVVGCAARSKRGLDDLMRAVISVTELKKAPETIKIRYPDYIEDAVSVLEPRIKEVYGDKISSRWLSLVLLSQSVGFADKTSEEGAVPSLELSSGNKGPVKEGFSLTAGGSEYCDLPVHGSKDFNPPIYGLENFEKFIRMAHYIKKDFTLKGITEKQIEEDIASSLVKTAEEIARDTVIYENAAYKNKDLSIDRLLTGKRTAFPIMLLALMGVFWLTITGANYPSQLISTALFWLEDRLLEFFIWANAPKALYEPLVLGVYRVLAWVVSVMLPPMAIFFPIFTLFEDAGFLPRVAFNLDKYFKKCKACGKQALTMCMGFGCNAAGVVGCRIIDSPRERLIAVITNNFVPCNGRFPPPRLEQLNYSL